MLSALLIAAVLAQVETSPAPAEPSAAASKINVSGKMTLEELRDSIEQQTGNKIVDYRQRFNQNATNPKLTLDIKNAPFWQALDAILDQTNLTVYTFSGKDGLALVDRAENELPRTKRATYAGPLRLEVTRLVSERRPGIDPAGSLKVNLEIAWEPHLTPITFLQAMKDLHAVDDQGRELHFAETDAALEAPVEGGTGVDLLLPFIAPPRNANAIASIKGTLTAIIPGKIETFEFDKLVDATKPGFKPLEKKKDAAHVVLEKVRKNNEIWEVLVRVRFDGAEAVSGSNRGWMLHDEAYIVGPDGKTIEKAGSDITQRTDNELGMDYQFELPETGLEGCTFVYKTASSIRTVPVPYEIKNLSLP